MKIKKITLHAFGKFIDSSFAFSPGLNLVYGENEAGKTTMGEFIFHMLYGQKKYGIKKRMYSPSHHRNKPWHHPLYQGMLHYSLQDVEYRMERNFQIEGEDVKIFEENTGQEITETFPYDLRKERQILPVQIGLNERNFINTVYVGQDDMKGLLFENQDNILEELIGKSIYGIEGDHGEKTLRDIIRGLDKKKRDIGTSKSKNKPLGYTYESLREKLKIKIQLEKKLESHNSYQSSIQKISEELQELREKKQDFIRAQNAWNRKRLEEKIREIEALWDEKNELIKYIEASFPPNIREESAENLYQHRQRNRKQGKNLLGLMFAMVGISVLTVIWAIQKPFALLQFFILMGALILFIIEMIQWKKFNRRDDVLFQDIEKIHQLQDANFELNRLEEQIKDRLKGDSLESLKEKIKELDHQKEVLHETFYQEEIELELRELENRESNLIMEQTIYETKKEENKWNPIELEQVERDIYTLEQEIKEMEENIQAIDIAISTLETIEKSDKIKWLPNIMKKTQENIYKITKKYHTIKIDDEYRMKTLEPKTGKMVNVEQLSQGTLNQFYLALRISLIESLSPPSITLPMIFDEPFLHFDNHRFHESMDLLEMLSHRHQIIIFSSQERERDYLKKNHMDYNYIEL